MSNSINGATFDSSLGGDVHWAKAKAKVEADMETAIRRQMEDDIAKMDALPSVYTRNPFEFSRDFQKMNPGKFIQNITAVRRAYGMSLKDAKDLVDLATGRYVAVPKL